MRTDKISSFKIDVVQSSLHKLEFAYVYPPGTSCDVATTEKLMNAYINYHLAIKPNVPIVLFQLASSLHDIGSKVYGGSEGCPEIYHLPPRIYTELEDVVAEGMFCVSQTYLEHVIRTKCVNKSIFALLEPTRQELGLNVIGIHETSEA